MRDLTGGRGPDAVLEAVGMEAHGSPVGKLAHRLAGLFPDAVAQKAIETAGIDRLSALHGAFELVRRGGTVSISGVYGGAASPMNLMQIVDKQIQIRGGQANVRRWVDELLPLVGGDDDTLSVESFATHHVPLGRRARRLRDVPEEGRRRVQGRVPTLRHGGAPKPASTPDPSLGKLPSP